MAYLVQVVVETFGNIVADGYVLLHRRTLVLGQHNLAGHVGIIHADDGFHRGPRVAVHDVVLGQHVCSGNHDGAQLVQGQHHHPPLVAALQDEHYGVVLADA